VSREKYGPKIVGTSSPNIIEAEVASIVENGPVNVIRASMQPA
jgi:hypothetical protein